MALTEEGSNSGDKELHGDFFMCRALICVCCKRLDILDAILQTAVGMLREVVESEHQVFVFKLVVFLLATVEKGGRDNALRFIRSGGASVLVPLVVLSLAKVRLWLAFTNRPLLFSSSHWRAIVDERVFRQFKSFALSYTARKC